MRLDASSLGAAHEQIKHGRGTLTIQCFKMAEMLAKAARTSLSSWTMHSQSIQEKDCSKHTTTSRVMKKLSGYSSPRIRLTGNPSELATDRYRPSVELPHV